MTALAVPLAAPRAVTPARPRRPDLVPLALAALAAVAFGTGLGRRSLWFDEAFSVDLAGRSWSRLVTTVSSSEGNQALSFVLLKLWPWHTGTVGPRVLSVVLATAAVPYLFALGRALAGRGVAVVACLAFALLPFTQQLAREARGYALLALLSTAAGWYVVDAVQCPRRAAHVRAGVALALLPYAHLYGLLVAVTLLGWALGSDAVRRRTWAAVAAAAGLAAAPVLLFFAAHRDARQIAWLARGQWATWWWSARVVGGTTAAGVALAALALVGAGVALRRRRGRLVLLWLLLTPAVALAYTAVGSPVYQARYLAGLAAPLCLGLALAWDALPAPALRGPALVLGAALLAAALPGHRGPTVREDLRDAAAYLAAERRPGDVVRVAPDYLAPALRVYGVPVDAPPTGTGHRVLLLTIGPAGPRLAAQHLRWTPLGRAVFDGDVEVTALRTAASG